MVVMMNDFEFHPVADLFPLMQGTEFEDLVNDIKQNGLREPVWLYENKVLDGRNRLRACNAAGVEPRFREYDGDDPVGFAVSLNLHRRHLTDDQRKAIAAWLPSYGDGEFLGNQYIDHESNNKSSGSLNSETPIKGNKKYTTKESAELMNVTVNGVSDAKKLKKQAIPILFEKVRSGEIRMSVAADISSLPKEQQKVVISLGEKTIFRVAKEIRSKKAKARQEENERLRQKALSVPPPEGQYRCIVMDPPWPMQKIERDVCPEQTSELDYPVMTMGQIMDIKVPAAEQCHLYLWTTQRFIWDARSLLDNWGFKHLAIMVWHKPGGFQPVGLPQYNCEFVLIGRKGSLEFNTTKNFPLCFQAPRREHSRKPDEFYQLVSKVSPGPRLDMFSRESRDGYQQFGVEKNVFL